ncbi:hypothetical protein BDP27DRAFT_1424845 [Rhodocollybia butyracea]|uniref:Uncharacterized protein n=1 Tax=Rhodocollybia butyracea TaxID=206335 RepID=A0A9P5PHE0_9AGAR|nr:hypothetical protein BDP27DRAFT_1424845 [Rhodocollybia butyracea]
MPSLQYIVSSNALPLMFNVGILILTSFAYGVFLLGTCIAIYLSITSADSRKPKTPLVCLVAMFFFSTWNMINIMAFYMNNIWFSYVKLLSILEDVTQDLQLIGTIMELFTQMELPYDYMQPWPPTIILMISDFVVTWRAWILFSHHKSWRWLLFLIMLANTAINLVDCILNVYNLSSSDINGPNLFGTTTTLDWISVILSLAVNALATILIIWKAWNHHRFLAGSSIQQRTYVQKILLLLIESGAIFCMIQGLYMGLAFVDKATDIDFKQLLSTYTIPVTLILTIAATWYPAAVTIIIHLESTSDSSVETFHIGEIATRTSENVD